MLATKLQNCKIGRSMKTKNCTLQDRDKMMTDKKTQIQKKYVDKFRPVKTEFAINLQ